MRGARFLSFMLVLLSPFGALTASQAAAAPMAGPASEKLGTVAFANSCAPEAQESFERGVALLHSFAFAAGEKAFREALDRDPACAIATWGIATILIGNTFALGPSPENAERAVAAIERGRAIGAKTQRERDYIEAIAAFYDRFARAAAGGAHALARGRVRSLGRPLQGRRRDTDFQRALSHRKPAVERQDLCAGAESGGDPRCPIRQASGSSGRRSLSHSRLRFSADRAERTAGGALLRRYRARRRACAAHAFAHLHARRAMEGIVETNARSAAAAKAENSHRPGAARHGLHGVCGSAIGARRRRARRGQGCARPLQLRQSPRSTRGPQSRRAMRWNASNGARPPRCPTQPPANFPISRR